MKTRERSLRQINFDGTSQLSQDARGGLAGTHVGIAKSLRYISTNYCRPIQVEDLPKIAGLSRRGYFKAFCKHVGFRPVQVLRHLRVEHAKRLLVESDLPLKQIAIGCGYRRVNSFWVAFRKVTGMSSMRFQRQTWFESYRTQQGSAQMGKQRRSRSLGLKTQSIGK